MSVIEGIMGIATLIALIGAICFSGYFVIHVLTTPDGNKIREIVREELERVHSLEESTNG